MKYLAFLLPFVLMTSLHAEQIRLKIDLTFEEPLSKEITDDLTLLQEILARLKPLSMAAIGDEVTTNTKTHKCKHDTGEPCTEEKEIDDVIFKDGGVEAKPTPTPKVIKLSGGGAISVQ